jgi:hypothetical protein
MSNTSRSSRYARLLLTGVLALTGTFWGSGRTRAQFVAPDGITAELATFGPGDQAYNFFGHTAIVITTPRSARARLYNYGVYVFDRRMPVKFLLGRLWFSTAVSNAKVIYNKYRRMNRDIKTQQLNLSPKRLASLVSELERDVRPENRDYLYHHYDNNCVTRVRDIIDRAVDGQLKRALSVPAKYTLREHTRRYASRNPALAELQLFWMNDYLDRPVQRWQELFLPDELARAIEQFDYTDDLGQRVPLVSRTTVVYRARHRPPPPAVPPSPYLWCFIVGISFALIGVMTGVWWARGSGRLPRVLFGTYQILVGLLFGLPGSLLAFMSTFSDNTVTYYNENLLLANPITLLAVPLGAMLMANRRWAIRALAFMWLTMASTTVLEMLFKLFSAFDQANADILLLLGPVNIAAGLFWYYQLKTANDRSLPNRWSIPDTLTNW